MERSAHHVSPEDGDGVLVELGDPDVRDRREQKALVQRRLLVVAHPPHAARLPAAEARDGEEPDPPEPKDAHVPWGGETRSRWPRKVKLASVREW